MSVTPGIAGKHYLQQRWSFDHTNLAKLEKNNIKDVPDQIKFQNNKVNFGTDDPMDMIPHPLTAPGLSIIACKAHKF
jgi:hypothetical protein